MTSPIFNSFYPWCKDKEPPIIHSPFPHDRLTAEGKGWAWGKVYPAKPEHYSKKSLSMNKNIYGPEGWVGGHTSRIKLENAIQWSDDEYIYHQWAPSDLAQTWEDNERKFTNDSSRRSNQMLVNHWEEWQEENYKRHWSYRNRYTKDEILYKCNTNGFRADDFVKTKNSSKFKVMSLGCSFTYGIGVRNKETFPQLISNHFDAVNWNLGVGGGSCKLALMIAEHMFKIGYIPNVVVVNWPNISRGVIPNKSRFEGMLDVVYDDILDANEFSTTQNKWEVLSQLGTQNNIDMMPDSLNPDAFVKGDGSSYPNHAWGYHPYSKLDSGGTDLINLVKDTDAYRSKEFENHTEMELLHFNDIRTKLSYMCKTFDIKLFETFYDTRAHMLALDLYKTEPDWRSETPICTGVFNIDRGRDGSHWGHQTHELVANHFIKLISKHI